LLVTSLGEIVCIFARNYLTIGALTLGHIALDNPLQAR
jgi:hypothetical protein